MTVLTAATPLAETQTPSGIEIRFFVEPKRLYEIRKNPAGRWKTVPSVTEVLRVLDKPALPWWGQGIGIQGTLTLLAQGSLQAAGNVLACWNEGQFVAAGREHVEDLLKRHKLTVNHAVDRASDRGLAVHNALEVWAESGFLPDPAMFPETEAGYVLGLRDFLLESKAESLAAEVMVGSAKHGFAGRYDLRLRLPEDVELVVHRTPKKGEQRKLFSAGVYLVDLKTSKSVYPSHARQLEAYEEASIECGYEPTDGRAVLHVSDKGEYELVPSWAEFSDFKCVLNVWHSNERMKVAKKEGK